MAGRQRHEGRAGSTGPTLSVTVRRAARLAAGTVALVGGVWCSSVAGASQTRSGGRDGGGTTWPPDPSADVQPPAIPDSVSVTQAQSWLAGALQLRAQELTSLENDVSNADNLPPSVRTQLNGDLTTASNGIAGLTASVQKASTLAALRVDARKWAASKLKPKKYMDSRAITGAEGGPVQIIISQDDSDL